MTAAHTGIEVISGDLDEVLVRLTGTGAGRFAINASNSSFIANSGSVTIRHATAVADTSAGATGLIVYASATTNSATQNVDLRSAILRGFATSVSRFGTTSGAYTGTANVTIRSSDYDTSTVTGTGPGSGPDLLDATIIGADPLFVDLAAGDMRLSGGSPAIDLGDPAGPGFADSPTDLGGLPRIVDGNGDGTARRDMGAFEYQRRAPQVSATAPATAHAGESIAFSAQTSDADGDSVALAWSFDDGATATGASASHAFSAPGNHLATVTATDCGGAAATSATAVAVTAGAAPARPAIRSLALAPRAFVAARRGASAAAKTGTSVSFALSVPARATFTVARAVTGRKAGGKCVGVTKRNRKAKRCKRYRSLKGSFARPGTAGANRFHFTGRLGTKALTPGSYRLAGTVGSGQTKSVSRATFKIKRPPR